MPLTHPLGSFGSGDEGRTLVAAVPLREREEGYSEDVAFMVNGHNVLWDS